MIYEDYLAALLRPLGVYDLRAGTVNRGELGAYGKELDGRSQELEDTAREMDLATARSFGLEWVKELLAAGYERLSDVAWRTGYSSVAHLSRQFKAVTGLTPTQYMASGHPRRSLGEV